MRVIWQTHCRKIVYQKKKRKNVYQYKLRIENKLSDTRTVESTQDKIADLPAA